MGMDSQSALAEVEQLYLDLEETGVEPHSPVVRHNSLARAKLKLSLSAHRVLLTVNSHLTMIAHDSNVSWVRITNERLRSLFPKWRRNGNLPAILSEVVDELMDKKFHVQQGGDWVKFRLVQSAAYYRGELFILIDRRAQELMLSLDDPSIEVGNFTPGTILDVSGLTSAYQMRLYDICKSYAYMGYFESYNIDDLREQIGVDEGLYVRNFHFFQRVLKPTCEAISKRTPLQINVNYIKKGKSVVGYAFKIETQKERLSDDRLDAMQALVNEGVRAKKAEMLAAVNEASVIDRYIWAYNVLKREKGYEVPWLIAAIRDRYELEIFKAHPASEMNRQILQLKRNQVYLQFTRMKENDKGVLLSEFHDWVARLAPPAIRDIWDREGVGALEARQDVKNTFVGFISNHPKSPKRLRVSLADG